MILYASGLVHAYRKECISAVCVVDAIEKSQDPLYLYWHLMEGE